ncbi:MAG: hypothetical protein P1U58_11155 [Verrucomicrobiales bacterium]|nr:hypothetical protein [Verrucomicrobiales bacterium]
MNLRTLLPAVIVIAFCQLQSRASDLTLEQIESIKKQAEEIEKAIEENSANRNLTAGDRFAAAAASPREAMDLYIDCIELVNYEREGRPGSDFREWREDPRNNLDDPSKAKSIQIQLRYLSLTCKAAEAKDRGDVIEPLMAYIESLSELDEFPTGDLIGPVTNSVFVKAYDLERFLNQNSGWEASPLKIGGMYEQTILPFLRLENPAALMNAWSKRIEQELRMVEILEANRESLLRGMDRDQQKRARDNQQRQERGSELLSDFDTHNFRVRTMPRLRWNKLKDMFLYVNEVEAVQAMLPFLKEHLSHELGPEFFADFDGMINGAATGSDRLP